MNICCNFEKSPKTLKNETENMSFRFNCWSLKIQKKITQRLGYSKLERLYHNQESIIKNKAILLVHITVLQAVLAS